MNDPDSKLDEVFEIVPQNTLPDRVKPEEDQSVDTDFNYSRENLYNIIERGTDAMEGLLQVAQETEHPRAYEVIATLIKTITDTNDKVVDLQKKAKDILSDSEVKKVTNNNLFVGSTTELTKILGGNARDILKK